MKLGEPQRELRRLGGWEDSSTHVQHMFLFVQISSSSSRFNGCSGSDRGYKVWRYVRVKGHPKDGHSLKASWRAAVVYQVHSMFHCFFIASVVTGSCKKVELKLKQAGQCLQHNVKHSFYGISIGQLHLNGCIVFPDALALEFKPRQHTVVPRQLISLMVQKSF
jgi:hypothetical protein